MMPAPGVSRTKRGCGMNTTLVINRKGGAGKTTVSINLASYFAAANVATTIMDYDPQGSSLHWLKLRNPTLAKIHGSNAAPEKANGRRDDCRSATSATSAKRSCPTSAPRRR